MFTLTIMDIKESRSSVTTYPTYSAAHHAMLKGNYDPNWVAVFITDEHGEIFDTNIMVEEDTEYDYEDYDLEEGFNPYEGCYDYDC